MMTKELLKRGCVESNLSGDDDVEMQTVWRAGDLVHAFYNFYDHPAGYRPLFQRQKGTRAPAPLVGLSEGWLQARVTEDFDPEAFRPEDRKTWVALEFLGTFADPLYEQLWEGLEEMRVKPSLVRIGNPTA